MNNAGKGTLLIILLSLPALTGVSCFLVGRNIPSTIARDDGYSVSKTDYFTAFKDLKSEDESLVASFYVVDCDAIDKSFVKGNDINSSYFATRKVPFEKRNEASDLFSVSEVGYLISSFVDIKNSQNAMDTFALTYQISFSSSPKESYESISVEKTMLGDATLVTNKGERVAYLSLRLSGLPKSQFNDFFKGYNKETLNEISSSFDSFVAGYHQILN